MGSALALLSWGTSGLGSLGQVRQGNLKLHQATQGESISLVSPSLTLAMSHCVFGQLCKTPGLLSWQPYIQFVSSITKRSVRNGAGAVGRAGGS